MKPLRLGIIGLSPGNGHPYSWSAIFNGFDVEAMAECGFPAIPAYLAKQRFPRDAIPCARVTSVWTQDKAISHKIAKAARIETVASTPEEMIGAIDAVLLARDDAENHRHFADPFIKAGLPIYVDKPFAHSVKAAKAFLARQSRAGQIFSCSAVRFAQEMLLSSKDLESIGGVTHISARVPNAWKKYAIHVIDPIIANCGPLHGVENVEVRHFGLDNEATEVAFKWGGGEKTCRIIACGSEPSPISVTYTGQHGTIETNFADSFAAFKAALDVFLKDSVRGRRSHADQILAAINILELGT